MLLAAASKFFSDKFITNPESLEHNILDIDGIDFDTLTSVVAYIYSGNIELTVEKTEKLIPASVSLMLSELTEECKRFLEKVIYTDISACGNVYRIAKANALDKTAKSAWGVMLDKFQEFTAADAFKDLSQTELKGYIKDTGLNVTSEDPVFKAVLTWVKHDLENRKNKFENLLEHVTLLHCSLSFLRDVVMQEPLMKSFTCFQRLAEILDSQASSQLLQLGTPRQASKRDALIAIYTDQFWVLRDGESKWLNVLATGKIQEYSSACRTRDGILITGGGPFPENVSKKCYKLSLPTLDWTAVSDLNVARRAHVSLCVDGQVFVLGDGSDSNILTSMEYLDEKTRSWSVATDVAKATPKATPWHTVVSYKHYIYFLSEFDSLVLDTVSETWSNKTPMGTEGGMYTESVVYRDRIYVMGGINQCCMSYNPVRDQWQTHSAPKEDHIRGSAVVWRDRILLCGGLGTTVIEEYNPHTDTWTDQKHSLSQQDLLGLFVVQL